MATKYHDKDRKMRIDYRNDYYAPELFDRLLDAKPYGAEVDVWSMGVFLHFLISGKMPAWDLIRFERYPFNFPEFDNVSQECRNLISKMIVYKPDLRLSSQEVLQHPWFKLKKKPKVKISASVWDKLIRYRGESLLKKTIINILVKMSTDEEVQEMTR